MKSKLLLALLPAVCLYWQTNTIHAQQSAVLSPASTGSVVGVLKDPSGAVIHGAHVELRSTIGDFHQTRISDHLGHFSFVSVPAGDYQLTVTAPGFANQILRPLTVVSRRGSSCKPVAQDCRSYGQRPGRWAGRQFHCRFGSQGASLQS